MGDYILSQSDIWCTTTNSVRQMRMDGNFFHPKDMYTLMPTHNVNTGVKYIINATLNAGMCGRSLDYPGNVRVITDIPPCEHQPEPGAETPDLYTRQGDNSVGWFVGV